MVHQKMPGSPNDVQQYTKGFFFRLKPEMVYSQGKPIKVLSRGMYEKTQKCFFKFKASMVLLVWKLSVYDLCLSLLGTFNLISPTQKTIGLLVLSFIQRSKMKSIELHSLRPSQCLYCLYSGSKSPILLLNFSLFIRNPYISKFLNN